ncbi:hypothetical protein D3C87_1544710 [compost metagenome]
MATWFLKASNWRSPGARPAKVFAMPKTSVEPSGEPASKLKSASAMAVWAVKPCRADWRGGTLDCAGGAWHALSDSEVAKSASRTVRVRFDMGTPWTDGVLRGQMVSGTWGDKWPFHGLPGRL